MADKYINADKLKENIKAEQKNNANMGMSVICDWFIEVINNEPVADVQPTEKFEEYRNLLEECERKLRLLLECEIESTLESQKVKELIAKIQSSLKGGEQNV